nr:MAG TPA: hypothetical protein [Bacteriophage sp.]
MIHVLFSPIPIALSADYIALSIGWNICLSKPWANLPELVGSYDCNIL